MSNHNDKNTLNSGEAREGNPELSNVPSYCLYNKTKKDQTGNPSKYPQGYFKDKSCRKCNTMFKPKSPSELYCSDLCKDIGLQDRYLLRTYGIDSSEYERMYKEQQGLCKICRNEGFVMDKSRHRVKLVVDHCHSSGAVRGLLCHNCNRALGLLQDDIDSLNRAVEYIESATTISKEST